LQTFWNEEEGYVSETTVTDVEKGGRSGKGSVPVSVAVLNFDPSLGCNSTVFQPCSDRALSSLKVLGDAFKSSLSPSTSLLTNPAHYSVPFTKNRFSEDT
jgi:glucoamylase